MKECLGCSRAFKMAGVQTIVMSLTEADDQTTMAMMNKFYTSLLSGQSSMMLSIMHSSTYVL